MKNFILTIELYNRDIMFHFGDKKSLVKELDKYYSKRQIEEMLKNRPLSKIVMGKTIYNEQSGAILVWLADTPKTPKEYGYLSHEIFHSVKMITDLAGIALTNESDEAFAYLTGFITTKVLEQIT